MTLEKDYFKQAFKDYNFHKLSALETRIACAKTDRAFARLALTPLLSKIKFYRKWNFKINLSHEEESYLNDMYILMGYQEILLKQAYKQCEKYKKLIDDKINRISWTSG